MASPHLIHIRTEACETQGLIRSAGGNLRRLTNELYETPLDAFDLFMLFSTSTIERISLNSRTNFNAVVHNSAQVNDSRTGRITFDNTTSYGSDGRLLGVNVLDTMPRGINSVNAAHEILHQWSSYTSTSLGLNDGTNRYKQNSSVASLLGGFEWIDNGNGTFTVNCAKGGGRGAHHASLLDQYMMGLIDGSGIQIFICTMKKSFRSKSAGSATPLSP